MPLCVSVHHLLQRAPSPSKFQIAGSTIHIQLTPISQGIGGVELKLIMILNKQVSKVPGLFQQLKFSYVSQKKLAQHLKGVDTSTKFGQIKWLMYYIRFIMKEGLLECKEDFKWFLKNTTKSDFQTQQQLERYYRIKSDMRKLTIPFLLNMLPLGSLLVVLMIKYSPETLPSWIQIYEDEVARLSAYREIMQTINSQQDVSQINFKEASLQELKILSLATTGRIVDGTVILSRITGKNYNITQPPLSYFSSWLLRRHIKRHLSSSVLFHTTPQATLEERIDSIVSRK